ncbi:MAG: CRTAC1 family protein [Verrucomicrobiia bacterium]
MNICKASRAARMLVATALIATLTVAVRAADQFVQVSDPGWTNSDQYSESSAWGDYDKDGFIDLFVANSSISLGPSYNFLYHNNGDGTFTPKSEEEVGPIVSDLARFGGGCWGDLNNDGQIDLLTPTLPAISGWPPAAPHVYLNEGNGRFRSADAGDLSHEYPFAFWGGLADYDNDGNLDAFLTGAWAETGHRNNLLFHGRGDGTFSLVTDSVVAADTSNTSLDGAWGDYDNDGLADLVVANFNSHDFFYHNEGHGHFRRLTSSIFERYASTHHAWGDYDNDGFLDVAEGYGGVRLLRNDRAGDFVVSTNWAFAGIWSGPTWADYDNDGNLDLLLLRGQSTALQLRLFHNQGNGTFTEVEDIVTRSAANWLGGGWGDYDNDGFMDLFVAETTGNNALYHNVGNGRHWIKFLLEGTRSNRSAIGANVRVQATIGGKSVWQIREVSGGNYCQNDLRPNFGLGDATKAEFVRIEWPSGTVQELTNVPVNQFLTVWEPPGLKAAMGDDGACVLTVSAEPNRTWRIEASVDLKTWQALATVNEPTTKSAYTDSDSSHMPRRFYRVVGQ